MIGRSDIADALIVFGMKEECAWDVAIHHTPVEVLELTDEEANLPKLMREVLPGLVLSHRRAQIPPHVCARAESEPLISAPKCKGECPGCQGDCGEEKSPAQMLAEGIWPSDMPPEKRPKPGESIDLTQHEPGPDYEDQRYNERDDPA